MPKQTKKTFSIEVQRTTYITYEVEAENISDARSEAVEKAEQDYGEAVYIICGELEKPTQGATSASI